MDQKYDIQGTLQEAIDNAKLPYYVGVISNVNSENSFFTLENTQTHEMHLCHPSVDSIYSFTEDVKGMSSDLDAILRGLAEQEAHAETQYVTKEDEIAEQAMTFAEDCLLPSGSGWDYDWDISIQEDKNTGRGILHCESYYEGINGETGMYLDAIPVVVNIPMDHADDYEFDFGKPFNGNPNKFDTATKMVEDQYIEAMGSMVDLFDVLEMDIMRNMEYFDSEKKRDSVLPEYAKQLGFEIPHVEAKRLQFDFSKFTKDDYESVQKLLGTVKTREECKAAMKANKLPEILVNGLSYKGKLSFNDNLKQVGLTFGFNDGQNRDLANAELPCWYQLAMERTPFESFQQKVKDKIREDVEAAIEMGNITKDILKSKTPKEAAKCIEKARNAQKKKASSVR